MYLCPAQTVRIPVSAVYNRITAYSNKQADALSTKTNQASLTNISTISGGVYGERRFMLEELSLYEAAVAVPTSSGTFGLRGGYFGSSDYNESNIGLAYGRKLGGKVSVGAQFNYYSFSVAGYGHASSINFEVGTLVDVSDQLHVGFHVYNPLGSELNKGEAEKLPAIYTAGLGYDASDKVFIGAEIQKVEGKDIGVNAGLHYGIGSNLFARAGFASANETYYLGLGVLLKNFRLDATASVHPQLGITPGLMLLFKRNDVQ